ncbi:mechanosensitive ion channel protein MscS, partial [Escherichia coli]|nr:mechanosensitive ion channel protein MscS [Escherichia coli]
MEKLDVMDASGEAVSWIVRNQDILLGYAVNLVAAVVIIIIGGIAARMISGVLNNLMLGRNIDATVAQFLSVLIRHA